MTESTAPTEGGQEPEDVAGEAKNKKAFEARQAELAASQNLREGAVPEQRPIASQRVDDPHSDVYKKLREAGDARADDTPMPFSAYTKAQSDAQAKKAAKESRFETRVYPGARGWIDNPGEPDHQRAVAINRVNEYASVEDELKAASGTEAGRFAEVKSYECMSRDGRAELLIVSAEHLKFDRSGGAEWGKTPIMQTLP